MTYQTVKYVWPSISPPKLLSTKGIYSGSVSC